MCGGRGGGQGCRLSNEIDDLRSALYKFLDFNFNFCFRANDVNATQGCSCAGEDCGFVFGY